MKTAKTICCFVSVLVLAITSHAATLTGTVRNATTSKPSAGDEVVLLKLAQGMEEAGRTKTDAAGKFSITLDDAAAPHLVRVIHQGVTYHKQAPPGTTNVEVDVYDAAKKLEGIATTVQVLRMQAGPGGQLQVSALYAMKNGSVPPRTLMSDRTFEFELPPGAQIESSLAVSGSGMPLNTAPVPDSSQKGRYYFVFPLRPGETRFQVNYHVPYAGELAVQTRALYPLEHFVAIVPKAMQFTASDAARFQPMDAEAGATTMVSTSVKLGETIAFKVSGTGEFPRDSEGSEAAASAAADTRPGGGLGPPSDAPDPLRQYRWWILAGLAVALVAGAFYVISRRDGGARSPSTGSTLHASVHQVGARPPSAGFASGDANPVEGDRAPTLPTHSTGNGAARSALLLEALKEELFRLEVERQRGEITEEEYQRAKAALDITIARALRVGKGTPSGA